MILPDVASDVATGNGAQPFHDILDGYFTLKESVRQLMVRHDMTWAWLLIGHAPVMEIEGLPPDAPVPLHLRDGYAGLIDAMVLTVRRDEDGGVSLIGSGGWRWLDGRQDVALAADIRLAEPAYVTGFGLSPRRIAKRIDAAEALAAAPVLLDDPSGFRPFSA